MCIFLLLSSICHPALRCVPADAPVLPEEHPPDEPHAALGPADERGEGRPPQEGEGGRRAQLLHEGVRPQHAQDPLSPGDHGAWQ